ncbi:MAG: glycosyltransferase family 39 protein, partial [Chitinophagales bacterium]|nr:glycosyltransferase family 39 protein [Chitinophagales bacterium]
MAKQKQHHLKTDNKKTSLEILQPLIPETYSKKAFLVLSAVLGVVMLWLSKDYGITGDENYHRVYGHHVMDFYFTLGKDDTATRQYGTIDTLMRFYGGFFDGTAAVLSTKVFKNSDEWRIRHGWNALLGWLAMVFTGLVAAEIAGWQAGLIALLFMAASPRFFGESMNNPKDIPLAMGYVLAYFFMLRFWKNIRNANWKLALGLGLSIGMAMGIRIGGLLLIPYFLLFYGLYFLQQYRLS